MCVCHYSITDSKKIFSQQQTIFETSRIVIALAVDDFLSGFTVLVGRQEGDPACKNAFTSSALSFFGKPLGTRPNLA